MYQGHRLAGLTEHYEGYGWIKVKRYVEDAEATCEERLAALEDHLPGETSLLIREVRKLAAEVVRLAADSQQGPVIS